MSLPKIAAPIYTMVIPSTGQKIKYRPFLVKEEKILMMAMQGEDHAEMADALKQIIGNCCQEDIDVDTLAPFDLEYFFLQLRVKSVGETVNLTATCASKPKGKKKACGNKYEFDVDISKILVEKDPDHSNKIAITDTVGVIMRYPDVDFLIGTKLDDRDVESILSLVIHCMVSIYDEKEVYKMKDTPVEETREFVEGLNTTQFTKIRNFFETMPKVVYKSAEACPKCKETNEVRIEGLSNFFG